MAANARPVPKAPARRAKARFSASPLTDSNRRPPPYHGGALPTELRGRGASVALVRRSGCAACRAVARLEWSRSAGPESGIVLGGRPTRKGVRCTYGWHGTRRVGTSTSSSRAPRTGCSRSSRAGRGFKAYSIAVSGDEIFSFSVWDSARGCRGRERGRRRLGRGEHGRRHHGHETNFGELMLSTTLGVSPARV